MARVLLTIDEVGVAIDVQERLERVGHDVSWDAGRAPTAAGESGELVIIAGGVADAHSGGNELASRIEGWRGRPEAPAVIVLGSAHDHPVTALADVELVTSTADRGGIEGVVALALERRFAGRMTANVARAALGISPSVDGTELAAAIIRAGRSVDPEIVRLTLERRILHYVWATPLVGVLRELRALEPPELELLRICTGATTIKTVVLSSNQEPIEAGRRLWALACAQVIDLGSEPPDLDTSERRRVAECRRHLRRREATQMPTAYDVLGVTRGVYLEDLEIAVRSLALRYSPTSLAPIDLGDARQLATTFWEQITVARSALYYELGQKQLEAFIDGQPDRFARSWGRKELAVSTAEAAFTRGQRALAEGEVFKAISDIAAAARAHPGHPVYESYLAWARYRAEVARGGDRAQAAGRERRHAEEHVYGARPFAQALVALGLLCVADADAPAARWHLQESLLLDPDLPAARVILGRLG